jgi:hypothetical protein
LSLMSEWRWGNWVLWELGLGHGWWASFYVVQVERSSGTCVVVLDYRQSRSYMSMYDVPLLESLISAIAGCGGQGMLDIATNLSDVV